MKDQEALPIEQRPWEDLTDSEKIERMRYVIHEKDRAITSLRSQVYLLQEIVTRHSHNSYDGSVSVKADTATRRHDGHICAPEAGMPDRKPWF